MLSSSASSLVRGCRRRAAASVAASTRRLAGVVASSPSSLPASSYPRARLLSTTTNRSDASATSGGSGGSRSRNGLGRGKSGGAVEAGADLGEAMNQALEHHLGRGDAAAALRYLREEMLGRPSGAVRPRGDVLQRLVVQLCQRNAVEEASEALLLAAGKPGAGAATGVSSSRRRRNSGSGSSQGKGPTSVAPSSSAKASSHLDATKAVEASAPASSPSAASIVSYSHVIEQCLRRGLTGRALELFGQARLLGVALDLPCCNHLLASLPPSLGTEAGAGTTGKGRGSADAAAMGSVGEAIDAVLAHVRRHGLHPTDVTYGCAMWAALRAGDYLKVAKLMQALDEERLPLPAELWLALYAATHRALHPETAAAGPSLPPLGKADRDLVQDLHNQAAVQLEALMETVIRNLAAARAAGALGGPEGAGGMYYHPSAAAAAAAAAAEEALLADEEEEDDEDEDEDDEDMLRGPSHHRFFPAGWGPGAGGPGAPGVGAGAGPAGFFSRMHDAAGDFEEEEEWEDYDGRDDDEEEDEDEEEGWDGDEDDPIGGDGDMALEGYADEEDGYGDHEDDDAEAWAFERARLRLALYPTLATLPTEFFLPPPGPRGIRPPDDPSLRAPLPWGPLTRSLDKLAVVAPQAYIGPFFEEEEEAEEDGLGQAIDGDEDDDLLYDAELDISQDHLPDGWVEAGALCRDRSSSSTSSSTSSMGRRRPVPEVDFARKEGQEEEEEGVFGRPLPDLTASAGASLEAQRQGRFGPMLFRAGFFLPPATGPAASAFVSPFASSGGQGTAAALPQSPAASARSVMADVLAVLDYHHSRGHRQRRPPAAAAPDDDDKDDKAGDEGRKGK